LTKETKKVLSFKESMHVHIKACIEAYMLLSAKFVLQVKELVVGCNGPIWQGAFITCKIK